MQTMDGEAQTEVTDLLRRAKKWWDHRADFRRRRARSRDYRRGHQWQETTEDEDGNQITEEQKIKQQGRIPWVINQVATVTRNLIGQWRQNQSDRAAFAVEDEDKEATEMINVKRRGTRRYNRADTVERNEFEELIISGACGFKATIEWDSDLERNEVVLDPVDQTRFFFNMDLEDRRMKNLRIIGELHDLSPDELIAAYAKDSNGDFDREKAEEIRSIYGNLDEDLAGEIADVGFDRTDDLDFYGPPERSLGRVIEVWTKRHKITKYAHDKEQGTLTELDDNTPADAIERLNAQRQAAGQRPIEVRTKVEETWMVRHLTPRGDVLWEMETPYHHDSHPYIVGLANLLDGEVWGLIEQIIDPQRWLNRLVTMVDHGMGAGAKGVLMVPEDSIPKEMSIDDFADEWSRQGGVIKIKAKKGRELPKEITTNSIKPGSFELIQQMKAWIEDTSGVTGAQMGEEPSSGTPASLFQQQIAQSSLTNLDLFESFFETVREMDLKMIQLLQQAIDQRIQLSEGPTAAPVQYRPEDVQNLKFDISMGSVRDTATFQQVFEEDLQTFLGQGYIDFGTYLEMSAHPKAETLLRVLQQRDPDTLELGAQEMQAATQAVAGEQTAASQAAAPAAAQGDGAPQPAQR